MVDPLAIEDRLVALRAQSDVLVAHATNALASELGNAFESNDAQFSARRLLDVLVESLNSGNRDVFSRYVGWNFTVARERGLPQEQFLRALDVFRDSITEVTDEALGAEIKRLCNAAASTLSTVPRPTADTPLGPMARRFLDQLLHGERVQAAAEILEATQRGMSLRNLYLDVFQPSQREVGRLWQVNEIGVAQEHYCTAATQLILSQVYPYMTRTERLDRRSVVVVCSPDNLHELGARMVADFFEMDGWDSYYLGASTPALSTIDCVVQQSADLLALSISMPNQMEPVRRLIALSRDIPGSHVPVLVGGAVHSIEPDLLQQSGADACARSADDAVGAGNRLIDMSRDAS